MEIEKLRNALEKDKNDKNTNLTHITAYIEWQLQNMPHAAELAEHTAQELIDGTIKLGDVWEKVVTYAEKNKNGDCAMIDAPTVFREVRKALSIDGVVSDEQAAGYFATMFSAPAPEPSGTLDVDFDSLFD